MFRRNVALLSPKSNSLCRLLTVGDFILSGNVLEMSARVFCLVAGISFCRRMSVSH